MTIPRSFNFNMSLMTSRQPKSYRWQKGDLISATEACELLGYKSSKNLRDAERRENLKKEFERFDCSLTFGIAIGGQHRFLRSEIDTFLTAKTEAAWSKPKK